MLERETRAHRITRLDRARESHLGPDQKVGLAALGREGDPAFAQALQASVVELGRLVLPEEDRRGQYTLAPDWKARLSALEARALVRETGKPLADLGRAELERKVRREVDLPGGKYLALERHDRIALAPKPPGMEIGAGQSVSASMKAAGIQITKGLGLAR